MGTSFTDHNFGAISIKCKFWGIIVMSWYAIRIKCSSSLLPLTSGAYKTLKLNLCPFLHPEMLNWSGIKTQKRYIVSQSEQHVK